MTKGESVETKESIKITFMQQYAKKDYATITIKGLCEGVPIARTTFYTYYNNIDELKSEIEDNLVEGLLSISDALSYGDLKQMDFTKFLDSLQIYIKNHWDDFYIFLISQPNLRFIDKWKAAIKQNFKRRYPAKVTSSNYDLIAEMIASATISAYTFWMKNPSDVKAEEMKVLVTKVLENLANQI